MPASKWFAIILIILSGPVSLMAGLNFYRIEAYLSIHSENPAIYSENSNQSISAFRYHHQSTVFPQ
jgi:hypothetical protein